MYSQVVHADVSLQPQATSYILGNYKPLNVLFSTCLIRKNKHSLSFAFQHSPSSRAVTGWPILVMCVLSSSFVEEYPQHFLKNRYVSLCVLSIDRVALKIYSPEFIQEILLGRFIIIKFHFTAF